MMALTGKQYRDLVAAYIACNFTDRGVEIYTEVSLGKSIIAKDRRIDIMVVSGESVFAIECKTQATQGTADEKIVYALHDLQAMKIPGSIVYAGDGFSAGVVQMLRAHPAAAFCDPDPVTLARDRARTLELDVQLAQTFGWWDLFKVPGRRFSLENWRKGIMLPAE